MIQPVLDAPISPLRQRLIDDMTMRRFSRETQRGSGVPVPTMNSTVSALRFFFTHMLDCPDLARKLVRLAHQGKLPVVLNRDEVARL